MNYQPTHFTIPENGLWQLEEFSPYLFTEEIAISVDVAIATGRPLLVAGPPGSGKSSLAIAMAGLLGARLYRHVFTSRTRLEELTAEPDQLLRLSQASAGHDIAPEWAYLRPGLLWWAFDPEGAKTLGGRSKQPLPDGFCLPELSPPIVANFASKKNNFIDTVLLFDEIDKAEPDLPNDLLEPLDLGQFDVPQVGLIKSTEEQRLVIITTNGERDLPPAFLRRCVSLVLQRASPDRLMQIGHFHQPDLGDDLIQKVAKKIRELHGRALKFGVRPPGTSEFLDALKACKALNLSPDSPVWEQVESTTLLKRTDWSEDDD